MNGAELPELHGEIPGPESILVGQQLRQVEASGISFRSGPPVFWRRALGATFEDLDGNRFLDFSSSFGVASVGHCHPTVTSAIAKQVGTLVHTMGGIAPHETYVMALNDIAAAVGRWKDTRVQLTTSGSESVELALKLAALRTGKTGVVAFHGSFHGQTFGSLSVSGQPQLRTPFDDLVARQARFVPFPDPYRPTPGVDSRSVADFTLEVARATLRRSEGGPIGALLVEPMQNAAGYIVPPKGFLAELRKLCSEFDVLLIADEVFTGFGRCGYWLLSDREDVVPDIACIGKSFTGGIGCSAVLGDKDAMDALATPGLVPLHGSTFAGNPVACAAIAATISVLRAERLVEKAHDIGRQLIGAANDLPNRFNCVGSVRGMGAAVAIDLVRDPKSRERDPALAQRTWQELLRRGVLTLITGLPAGNVIALCPPLVASEKQCAYVIEALSDSLDAAVRA